MKRVVFQDSSYIVGKRGMVDILFGYESRPKFTVIDASDKTLIGKTVTIPIQTTKYIVDI